jgi:HEAT repeat protein/thiol-disulfide isomerase/thioredoxin
MTHPIKNTILPTWLVPAVLLSALLIVDVQPLHAQKADDNGATDAAPQLAPWMNKLDPGLKRARNTGRPVLLRFDDENCAYCRALDKEIATEEVQAELKNWLLVKVDIDDATAAARRMRVTGVPAMRILSPIGRVVARQDGALVAEDLVAWLEESRAAAVTELDDQLLGEGEPNILTIASVSVYLGDRDVALREAAIRRLAPYPHIASRPVIEALADGSLATRLSALELLTTWRAPLGDIDPWQPGSIDADSLSPIHDWAKKQSKPDGKESTERPPVTKQDLTELRGLIDRMIRVPADEVAALRERISRGGEQLLPDVYARLKSTDVDSERERLTALRYRLVANQRTALEWPAGFGRLASLDLTTRKNAADELAKRADVDDERLLLELFSDPAPLVREISLRALKTVGSSRSDGALVKLLDDPEPNIRAAVLSLLAETPSKAIVGSIVEYVERETDPDLIVHAVRFLREVKGEKAVKCLITTLGHENWRIRAESAEALGKCFGDDRYSYGGYSGYDQGADSKDLELKADAWSSLVERLEDPDAFVVSRSAEALSSANLPIVIDPLAAVVTRHPDLAGSILQTMTALRIKGATSTKKINNHLVTFAGNKKPAIRAAAVSALAARMAKSSQPHLAKAIADKDESVRIAAANGMFRLLDQEVSFGESNAGDGDFDVEISGGQELGGLFGAAAQALSRLSGIESSEPVIEEEDVEDPLGDMTEEDYEQAMVEALKEASGVEPAPANEAATEEKKDEPIVAPENTYGIDRDKKLAEIANGKFIGKWFREQTEPLMRMASSESLPERVAAARVLTALGKQDVGLPILRDAVAADSSAIQDVAGVLQWLPWKSRSDLFDHLITHAGDETNIVGVVQTLGSIRDDRGANKVWSVLERDGIGNDVVQMVESALIKIYTGQFYIDPEETAPSLRRFMAADAQKRLKGAGYNTQLVALRMAHSVDPTKAYEMAQELMTSAEEPKQRKIALAFVLLSAPKPEANQHAITALKSEDVELQRLGLQYLTSGTDGLPPELVPQSSSYSYSYGGSESGKPIIPELPSGVTADLVRPLANSDDVELRALATYSLILLAESTDLRPVLAMRTRKEGWDELAYRAIAFVDDSNQVPLLTKMYEKNKDNYGFSASDFYWTIRIMSGSEILALRKRIREELGMDQLR